MKKIINNRQYDTDKAKFLGENTFGEGINGWSEALYQKRTGEFFLFGEGGAATKYAVSTGSNSWKGGAKIIPLDVDAAKAWCEENLSAEDYGRIFGLPEDGNTIISASLPAGLVAQARQEAQKQGVSLTAVIEAALQRYL